MTFALALALTLTLHILLCTIHHSESSSKLDILGEVKIHYYYYKVWYDV